MSEHEKIRELIDACRPGADDLGLPEMGPLAEQVATEPRIAVRLDRSQRWDEAMCGAFQDVDIPDGLVDRLLSAVTPAGAELPALVDQAIATEAKSSAAASATMRSRWSRRKHWLTGSFAAFAVVAATVLVLLSWGPRQELDGEQELLAQAGRWPDLLNEGRWNEDPGQLKVRHIKPLRVLRWKTADQLPCQGTLCVELATADGGSAWLYIIPTTRQFGLSPSPPLEPKYASGRYVAAWQAPSEVYVLVLDDRDRYRDIMESPANFALVPPAARSLCATGKV